MATFDSALSVTTLEFVRDPFRALAARARVAPPGGWMVVTVLNAHSPWAAILAPYRAPAYHIGAMT